jgi:hypothetical protein
MLKTICGVCNQSKASHGREDGIVKRGATPLDDVLCFRDPDTIGQSYWHESVLQEQGVTRFYAKDPEYIEALGLVDAHTDEYKVYPRFAITDVMSSAHDEDAPKRFFFREGPEQMDYFQYDGVDIPSYDVSGPGAKERNTTYTEGMDAHRIGTPLGEYVGDSYVDEMDYRSETDEVLKLERWRDVAKVDDAFICTPTLEQHQAFLASPSTSDHYDNPEVVLSGKAPTDETQTAEAWRPYREPVPAKASTQAFVEGSPGFTVTQLFDELITAKYQKTLLNVYTNKTTGNLMVGSVEIKPMVDGKIIAQCVQNACRKHKPHPLGSVEVDPNAVDRATMEKIVWAIIAHGNNHSARWYKERVLHRNGEAVMERVMGPNGTLVSQPVKSWHKVHVLGCDISVCDPASARCTSAPGQDRIIEHADQNEYLAFLKEHKSVCKDSKCLHDEHITMLSPKEEVAA